MTPGRSTSWSGWSNAEWRWQPPRATCRAVSRSAVRSSSRSLRTLAHVGTRDATNSFKAYSTEFVREVGIDSRDGFEIGIELTAKAKRLRLPVAEIPTIWLDRQAGISNFKVAKWVPSYVRWYRFAFGPQLTAEQVRSRGPGDQREQQKSQEA
jgi:dolichol-phosphate mannosyltransferase